MDDRLAASFIAHSRWLLGTEYPTKLRACLTALPVESLWTTLAPGTNSIGNLLLHLRGNLRQWIVSGVGGAPDTRDRTSEFAARSGPGAEELIAALDATIAEACDVLDGLTTDALLEPRTIQSRDVSVLEAVYHVTEHFAMHTGQIIMMTKILAPGTIRFYDDANGLAHERWRALIRR